MDLIILAVLAAAVLLGIAAQLWGADSRSSFVDPRVTDPWVA
jgi:hypothetical protein